MRVLIVEDDTHTRVTFEAVAKMHNCVAISFNSAEKALEHLESFKPNLILSDYNLGMGMNGVMFVEELRKRKDKTRVVLITGDAHPQMIVDAISKGAAEVLCKPLELEHFAEVFDATRAALRKEAIFYYGKIVA